MGGCASKPRELKEEELAPLPIEEIKPKVVAVEEEAAATEAQVTNDVVAVVDERKSLGHLFKENEETKVEAPETKEVVIVKEAVVEPAVEPKEEEDPKTKDPPADEKFITTTTVPEKTPAPSEAIATEEKHVDSSLNDVVAQTAEVEAVVAGSPKFEAKQAETQEPTADEKFITPPVPEKTPAPSEAIATEEEKHVDSSSNVVEALTAEAEAVVAEKTPSPSEAIATEEEKHVDSSSNVVEALTAEAEAVVAEKTPAPSEAIATEEEKHVDSSSHVVEALTAEVEAAVAESPEVEQKEAVVPVTTSSPEKVGVEVREGTVTRFYRLLGMAI